MKYKNHWVQAQLLIVDKSTTGPRTRACIKLNLVKRVFIVTRSCRWSGFTHGGAQRLFEGIGCLPGEDKTCVDTNVPPVVQPYWKIQFVLWEKLTAACMDKLQVIKKIDEERLRTFNTPEGRYRFLCLQYNILSALCQHIAGLHTMMDDIIVWGTTREEHNKRLRQMLDKTREVDLKLNRDKYEFGVKNLPLWEILSVKRGWRQIQGKRQQYATWKDQKPKMR